MGGERYNRLIKEKSPYLLQHASNPVDWYPWGDEAFEKARREDKPIFLSIGYSTCHWCHVMEHESFSDNEVARQMNDTFVSIKVDREERPDLDNLYMSVCNMLTGSGGWPLTIIMTPDKKPFFAGTYFPKQARFGRAGLLEIIPFISDAWKNKRDEVLKTVNEVSDVLKMASKSPAGAELTEKVVDAAYGALAGRFDSVYGGFGDAPKFPTPHVISFLLRYWKRKGVDEALWMAEETLRSMRRGGVFDQLGFGFHRYSVDREWIVPHFEKMLYDQALLAVSYIEAYQATGKEEYGRTAREIFEYVLSDMTSPDGGFYSAEDADSEGEEGKFYLWSRDEVVRLLGSQETELAARVWNIDEEGNFTFEGRKGVNILHLRKSLAALAKDLKIPEEELGRSLESVRTKLLAEREKRVRPKRDDKVLADWNGLMIAALAKGAQAFDDQKYADAARHAADFIIKRMRRKDGGLFHRYREGESAIPAYIDDYAFFVYGLLELYEATFDVNYLKTAIELNEIALKDFWDDTDGGFYFSSRESEELLVRKKEIYDGAVPSGNSVAMLNLLRLGRMTANSKLEEYAAGIGRAFSKVVRESPASFTQLMVALDFAIGHSREVVLAGNLRAQDTREMFRALRREFLPNKVVLFNPTGEKDSVILEFCRFMKHQPSIDGKATAYVCTNYACERPTTEAAEMLKLLGAK